MNKNILILGCGPSALEAAASILMQSQPLSQPLSQPPSLPSPQSDPTHANANQIKIMVVERGAMPGYGIEKTWGDARMFSNWDINVSEYGLKIIKQNQSADYDVLMRAIASGDRPNAQEYLNMYLFPLVNALKVLYSVTFIFGTEVVKIGKTGGVSKGVMSKDERRKGSFNVLCRVPDFCEKDDFYLKGYTHVLDCTGVSTENSHLGIGGLPCINETKANVQEFITKTLPSANKDAYGDKTVAVVGSGYSAITSIITLVNSGVKKVYWITRKDPEAKEMFEIQENDVLPSRKVLCESGNALCKENDSGVVHVGNSGIVKLKMNSNNGDEIDIHITKLVGPEESENAETVMAVSKIFSHVGMKPDTSLSAELQVHYCYATEGPMKLAASLMAAAGGGGDCMAQVSGGIDTLMNPEQGFYVLGGKSYGRKSSYLLRVGVEQAGLIGAKIGAE